MAGQRLAGRRAIITGAAGDIGRAASTLFVAEGARVLLVDRDADGVAALAGSLGGGAVHEAADVADETDTERYVRAARERLGGVDLLLANAGVEGPVAPITEHSTEAFDRVMAVNVRGVWLALKHAMPEMARAGGGSVVITSSSAGVKGHAGLSAYVASKHAVVGIMRSAAGEGARHGIRVNTVNPGPVESRMIRSIESMERGDRTRRELTDRIHLRRYAQPEEVARLMLFLASDESSFCTGGVYMADGGLTAG